MDFAPIKPNKRLLDQSIEDEMEAALAALAATDLAQALRMSRWSYAAVSGLHILGIAVLVGAILLVLAITNCRVRGKPTSLLLPGPVAADRSGSALG